jgi:hypothetical protein
MAISIHAGGSVQKRLQFGLAFGNQAHTTKAAMALIENGANVNFPDAKVSSLSSFKKFAAAFFV